MSDRFLSRRVGLTAVLCLLALSTGGQPPAAAAAATWAEADTLIAEQKYEAAAAVVTQIRASAQAAGHEEDWTRALVREVQLSLRAKQQAEYVHLRDPRGAGFEPMTLVSGFKWHTGIGVYEEVRDSGASFFFEWLPVGEYTFRYRVRAATAGTFRVGPAQVQSMYAPEFAARSAGAVFEVSEPAPR